LASSGAEALSVSFPDQAAEPRRSKFFGPATRLHLSWARSAWWGLCLGLLSAAPLCPEGCAKGVDRVGCNPNLDRARGSTGRPSPS